MFLKGLIKGIRAFGKATSPGAKFMLVVCLLLIGVVIEATVEAFRGPSPEEQVAWTRARDESERSSRDQMLRNMQGTAHDSFTCNTSTENKPIVSFDNGRSWWSDDGRCAATEQKKRDDDAQLSSYWPATIRVDTDMDSFWLQNEERSCQTYPDDKGRVAVVACNTSGSHRDHNIPVKFWGGVDRNTVSNWKCRRESDGFVCRALD